MKFIIRINNEYAQDYSCPVAIFFFLFIWRKVTSARQVTRCCTTGDLPLEVTTGQRKTHVNSNRCQTVDRGKINAGVSDFPRVHESWP